MAHESSKLVGDVALLNNKAVSCMECGDYVYGSRILQSTIDAIQKHHDCLAGFSGDGTALDFQFPVDSICSLSRALPSTMEASEHAPLGIFDRAFFIDQRQVMSHSDSAFGIRQFCLIVLLFNMGVCMHIQAYMAHKRQDEFFAQAVTVYHMACGLLESSSDERMMMLLHLGITNNLACIHAHFCNVVETKQWLEEVRFNCTLNAKLLQNDEWALFSTNLLVNDRIQARLPAAA